MTDIIAEIRDLIGRYMSLGIVAAHCGHQTLHPRSAAFRVGPLRLYGREVEVVLSTHAASFYYTLAGVPHRDTWVAGDVTPIDLHDAGHPTLTPGTIAHFRDERLVAEEPESDCPWLAGALAGGVELLRPVIEGCERDRT